MTYSRREVLAIAPLVIGLLARRQLPAGMAFASRTDPDRDRLARWCATLRRAKLVAPDKPLGAASARVGELACGTPYVASTLEEYLRAGGSPLDTEPLTLSLTRFDCVTLVESCLGVARTAASDEVTWERFGREIERMRYRGGVRGDYGTRLHYFSEWISDGARRGLVRDVSRELGGVDDRRPLRFMSSHRSAYPALASEKAYTRIREMERGLETQVRVVVPTERIPKVLDLIRHGDVLAFATSIDGLDVTHAAMAYRHANGRLGVLHAPLSGGVVEVAQHDLPQYVGRIRHSTGILVARPLWPA